MGWFDSVLSVGEAAFGGVMPAIENFAPKIAKTIPGVSEAIGLSQAVYHTGSAVYDGVTGDRDGAISHGVQAAWGGIGAIPGVGEITGALDLGGAIAGTGLRAGAALTGHDPDQMPGGFSDVLSGLAVAGTNAVFGPDDSNWFAAGNTPQGSREGEIQAGLGTLGGVLGGGMGPVGMALGALGGVGLGSFASNIFGSSEKPGTTSGATPGLFAQAGQSINHAIGGTAAGTGAGAMLGGMMLPGIGAIPGALAGGLIGHFFGKND
jgi:hypothetical protein